MDYFFHEIIISFEMPSIINCFYSMIFKKSEICVVILYKLLQNVICTKQIKYCKNFNYCAWQFFSKLHIMQGDSLLSYFVELIFNVWKISEADSLSLISALLPVPYQPYYCSQELVQKLEIFLFWNYCIFDKEMSFRHFKSRHHSSVW